MRLLIYGAGVIGCWYAVLFSKAGYDTTVYARGKRYELFAENGLRYELGGKILRADVRLIDHLAPDDCYDYVFLTVRQNQAEKALEELADNISPCIVTMVNTIEPYESWERLCGRGRVLPAFPGAGGGFENGILKAALTPRLIQPTTCAEMDGETTERLNNLIRIFRKAGIPYQVVRDMQNWQLCHLAMVVPIADAYDQADEPEMAWKEADIMRLTAVRMKENFRTLHRSGITLSPAKMHLFRLLPIGLLQFGLKLTFRSSFGDVFMYRHSINAPDEMRTLHDQFYGWLREHCSPDETEA